VVVVGLSGLGKPLNSQYVHRVDKFSELSGLNQGDEITIEAISKVLKSRHGGLKGIPVNARRVCLVNQADNEQLEGFGHRLARYLLSSYHSVIIASLIGGMESPADQPISDPSGTEKCAAAVHEPVVGIILAAGGSQRLGRPKQLLTWKGRTLIDHVARAAISADFSQVFVVLGAYSEAVRDELNDLPVTIIQNSDWQSGQSTSIQVALQAVPVSTGAAVFLLADQPKVSISVIRALVEKHAATLAPIIVPMVDGKRGNPVLFDRSTFHDFQSVKGDVGGRQLFSKYPITWLNWHDPSILMDIDTDGDYQQLVSNSNENTI
jgi:molybdenum cofactor cytidylyltransferase